MITELVGPSGAGKTTLMSALERELAVSVMTVPHIFTKFDPVLVSPKQSVAALLRGVASAMALSVRHRVPPGAWLRLARSCVAFEHAYSCIRHLKGDWFVDEGPLRLLRDRKSGSGAEFAAWKLFATRAIERISTHQPGIRMIVLEVPAEVRERRYRERMRRSMKHRRLVGGFRNRLGLFLDEALLPAAEARTLGTFVDDAVSRTGSLAVEIFRCGAAETPEQVSRRFVQEVLLGGPTGRYSVL